MSKRDAEIKILQILKLSTESEAFCYEITVIIAIFREVTKYIFVNHPTVYRRSLYEISVTKVQLIKYACNQITTFIRPILEYGNEIWDNCTQYEKEEIDKIQNEAARIATGTTKLVSIETLYSEIGWETLDSSGSKNYLFFTKCIQIEVLVIFPLLYHLLSAIFLHIT